MDPADSEPQNDNTIEPRRTLIPATLRVVDSLHGPRRAGCSAARRPLQEPCSWLRVALGATRTGRRDCRRLPAPQSVAPRPPPSTPPRGLLGRESKPTRRPSPGCLGRSGQPGPFDRWARRGCAPSCPREAGDFRRAPVGPRRPGTEPAPWAWRPPAWGRRTGPGPGPGPDSRYGVRLKRYRRRERERQSEGESVRERLSVCVCDQEGEAEGEGRECERRVIHRDKDCSRERFNPDNAQ